MPNDVTTSFYPTPFVEAAFEFRHTQRRSGFALALAARICAFARPVNQRILPRIMAFISRHRIA